jgi:hypothetical protein
MAPGEEVEKLVGLTVHARCFAREAVPHIQPAPHPDDD